MPWEGHRRAPPPPHCVAARSPSAASGRSNHFIRTMDGRMVWSSGHLERESRVTVAAHLPVHKHPFGHAKSMRCGPTWRRRPRRAGCGMRLITRRGRCWRMFLADVRIKYFCSSKGCSSRLASDAMTPIIGAPTPDISIPPRIIRASGTCSRWSANM